MPDMEFNTTAGQTVDRELLVAYLNTGDSSTPVWSPWGPVSQTVLWNTIGRRTLQKISLGLPEPA